MFQAQDKVWFESEKKQPGFLPWLLSLCAHFCLFLLFVYLAKTSVMTVPAPDSLGKSAEKPPIQLSLVPGSLSAPYFPTADERPQVPAKALPENGKQVVRPERRRSSLRQPSRGSVRDFSQPKEKDQRGEVSQAPAPVAQGQKQSGLSPFLPDSSSTYRQKLREESARTDTLTADGGDVPISGELPAPRNGAPPQQRFVTRDMSLLQFSQEFKKRFGQIWNVRDRWVSPDSPLRPGDVVYYKVFIRGDGSLLKVENLTREQRSGLRDSVLDKMVEGILREVLPMEVPPSYADKVVTEMIAIQVVSGSQGPIRFSF